MTPWSSVYTEPERLDTWLLAARSAGMEPLVAFEHRREERCPEAPCRLPSTGIYRAALTTFLQRYPWVRLITPWNEANHQSQPTDRDPASAAAFYNVARAVCASCTLVAGDVLDEPGFGAWVMAYRNALVEQPAVWGLHNYFDMTRFSTERTQAFLALVQGDVWLTEAGGIVFHRTVDGRIVHAYDEERAAKSLDYGFYLARRFQDRIARFYVYHWRSTPSARWDSALLRPTGAPRPAFYVFQREARSESNGGNRIDGRPTARETRVRMNVSASRLTRRGRLSVRLACSAGSPGQRCSGRISVEGAGYRRASLINGRSPRGILERLTRRIRLRPSSHGTVRFRVPRGVRQRIAGAPSISVRITLVTDTGTSSYVTKLMPAGA